MSRPDPDAAPPPPASPEAERDRAREELQAFAYAVSHDLAAPARTVASFAGLLERRLAGKLDDDTTELLAFLVDGSVRLQAMLDGLLRFSRVTHGPYAPQDVALADVAAEVLEALRARVAETGAQVRVDELPVVRGERAQLAVVLHELLDNALRFADGPPRVRVSSAPAAGGGHAICVRDHGPGVDPVQADRALAMFGRLQGREADDGVGAGLAIAARIVERHGGTLGVAAAPGGGSAFTVTLPA